jgi:flagellar motility protein MotE (MotC chaperone)
MPAGDVADIVSGAATDSVVGALLTMAETEAARIISRCPYDVAGKLVGAMAADQSAPAGKILDMIAAGQAGRILDHMNPSDAASVLGALPPAGAVRILSRADAYTAVGALTEMAPRSAGQVITAMDETRAADVLAQCGRRHLEPPIE